MSRTIDRIRKLLALSKDGSNENESEVAGNLAAKLMEAAGLSEDDITDSIVDEVTSVKSVRSVLDKKEFEWKRFAAFAAARMTGCRSYTSGVEIVIVGSDRQRDAANELYTWLCAEIERRAKIAGLWRKINDFNDATTYVYAFRIGMASAIHAKAITLMDLHVDKPTDSKALERKDKLKQAIDALIPRLGHGKAANARNGAGMAAGSVQGSSVELRRAVGASNGNGPRRLGK